MHITPQNIGLDSTTSELGRLFVSSVLGVDPHLFAYSRIRTESSSVASNGILCTFKPNPEDTVGGGGGWRLHRFKGMTMQETNSSLHLLRRIAQKLSQANIDADKPPSLNAPYSHERLVEMIRLMLVNGSWTNSTSPAWPMWTWETNQLYTWRDIPAVNGIVTSQPLALFTTDADFRTAFRFSFEIHDSPLSLQPFYEPMFKRKARKWGRSFTERWEDEHTQLVNFRKFKRNAAKVEADSMALRKPRGPKRKPRTPQIELSLLNSLRNQGEAAAKRAALSAAKAAQTATRKHVEKKGAKRVVSALAKKLKRFGHGPAEKPTKRKKITRRRK